MASSDSTVVKRWYIIVMTSCSLYSGTTTESSTWLSRSAPRRQFSTNAFMEHDPLVKSEIHCGNDGGGAKLCQANAYRAEVDQAIEQGSVDAPAQNHREDVGGDSCAMTAYAIEWAIELK